MVFKFFIILDIESVALIDVLFQRVEVLGDMCPRVRSLGGMIVVKVVCSRTLLLLMMVFGLGIASLASTCVDPFSPARSPRSLY